MKKAKKNKPKNKTNKLDKLNKNSREILLTTTGYMSGYEITESIGLVQGSTILKINKNNIKQYHDKIENARMNSLKKIIAQARQLECGAIIGLRFEITCINKNLIDILAYGTSVKIEKK